jgi:hypothetical protein
MVAHSLVLLHFIIVDSAESNVAAISVSASTTVDGNIALHLDLAFVNNMATKRKFNYLLNCILAPNCHESNMNVRNIQFGASPEQSIGLLSKVFGDLEFHQEGIIKSLNHKEPRYRLFQTLPSSSRSLQIYTLMQPG